DHRRAQPPGYAAQGRPGGWPGPDRVSRRGQSGTHLRLASPGLAGGRLPCAFGAIGGRTHSLGDTLVPAVVCGGRGCRKGISGAWFSARRDRQARTGIGGDSMKNDMSAVWGRITRYAWLAGFVLLRTHYFMIANVLPFFGWR